MLTIYVVSIVVALLLASASNKLPEVVSTNLLWHDGRGISNLLIFAIALFGFGASGATILYFGVVKFNVDSLVFSVPVAVFIILGFVSKREDGYTTK